MMLPIKTIMSALDISTYIIVSIAARPIRLAATFVTKFVLTFKTTVIPYTFV